MNCSNPSTCTENASELWIEMVNKMMGFVSTSTQLMELMKKDDPGAKYIESSEAAMQNAANMLKKQMEAYVSICSGQVKTGIVEGDIPPTCPGSSRCLPGLEKVVEIKKLPTACQPMCEDECVHDNAPKITCKCPTSKLPIPIKKGRYKYSPETRKKIEDIYRKRNIEEEKKKQQHIQMKRILRQTATEKDKVCSCKEKNNEENVSERGSKKEESEILSNESCCLSECCGDETRETKKYDDDEKCFPDCCVDKKTKDCQGACTQGSKDAESGESSIWECCPTGSSNRIRQEEEIISESWILKCCETVCDEKQKGSNQICIEECCPDAPLTSNLECHTTAECGTQEIARSENQHTMTDEPCDCSMMSESQKMERLVELQRQVYNAEDGLKSLKDEINRLGRYMGKGHKTNFNVTPKFRAVALYREIMKRQSSLELNINYNIRDSGYEGSHYRGNSTRGSPGPYSYTRYPPQTRFNENIPGDSYQGCEYPQEYGDPKRNKQRCVVLFSKNENDPSEDEHCT